MASVSFSGEDLVGRFSSGAGEINWALLRCSLLRAYNDVII